MPAPIVREAVPAPVAPPQLPVAKFVEPVKVVEAAAEPVAQASPVIEPSGASWPDDSAESSFLAEARERGEPIASAKAKDEIADETDAKSLPPLSELVNRIPAEVRETLEDLFRARFVTVKRVPKRALKT